MPSRKKVKIMIKRINEKDIENCVYVIRNSFQTVADEFNITKENAPRYVCYSVDSNKIKSQFKNSKDMFAYFIDDKPVGYYSLSFNDNECEINNLCVLPEYRHKNIGKQLLNHAIEFAKEKGNKWVNVSIVEENIKLKEWYQSMGFVHLYTEKFDFFPFTCGYMKLDL